MSNKHGSKWIRPERRRAIYARDNWQCVYCGADDSLTLDHVVPRAEGGGNESENLVTACLSCNSSRKTLIVCVIVVRTDARARAGSPRRALPGSRAAAKSAA